MAGKRLHQDNQPIVSPTDYKERKAKNDAIEAQRAAQVAMRQRIKELEDANVALGQKAAAAEAETESQAALLAQARQQLDNLKREKEQELDNFKREKEEMDKKLKAIGAEKPLENPIEKEDLELKQKPAQARQLPKTKDGSKEEAKEKAEEPEESSQAKEAEEDENEEEL